MRSPSCTARRRTRRRSSSTCLAATGSRWRPSGARPYDRTPLGHSLLALARVALTNDTEAGAEDLIEYLRGPGMADRADAVDRLESVVRRRALRTVAEARHRADFELPEVDALRAAEDPGAELLAHARRLLAAPHRLRAPVLDAGEELDARAVGTLARALAELEELGDKPTGPELIELLEALELPSGPPAGPGAVLLTDPLAIRARRFRAVLVCGLQENEFPLAPAPEPFLSDELRRELAACSGLRLRPREDALARERYLFYTSVVPRDRTAWSSRIGAPTRRGTSRCPPRSWPTSPSCSPKIGPTGAGAGCSPTSCGRRTRRPPSGSWRARARRRSRRLPARCPRRSARCRRSRSSMSATARSCPPARSSPTPAAPCGG